MQNEHSKQVFKYLTCDKEHFCLDRTNYIYPTVIGLLAQSKFVEMGIPRRRFRSLKSNADTAPSFLLLLQIETPTLPYSNERRTKKASPPPL